MDNFFIRFVRRGKPIDMRKILLPNGENVTVSVYSKEGDICLGQVTPANNIIVNEILFKTFSKRVQDYVLLHEFGHKRSSVLVQLLVWVVVGFSAIAALLLSVSLFSFLFSWIVMFLINPERVWVILPIVATNLVLLFIFLLVSWFGEINADFYAIKIMGLEKVKQAKKEIKQKSKINKIQKLVVLVTHPPNFIVLRLCRLLYKH